MQAYSHGFWGLEGQNLFLEGRDSCFYYMFKTFFSPQQNLREKNNLGSTAPECPRSYGSG